MKGSQISPHPAAMAAHPHPAGAEAIRLRYAVFFAVLFNKNT